MESSVSNVTPWKWIFRFSGPIFMGILLQQLYNTVDTIVVGNYAGQDALSAVGTTASLITLFLAAAIGLSGGAGTMVSQYFGAGEKEKMQETAKVSITFLLVTGVAVTFLGLILGRIFIHFFLDVPEDIAPLSISYFNIYMLGMVFQFGYNIVAAILRSVGDSKASMYFLLIASAVNILLDLLFVGVFHMGAAGAAIATDISQAASCVASFIYMNRRYSQFRFGVHDFKWDGETVRQILRIGFPVVLQQMFVGLGIMSIQRAVNSYGKDMMASFTVASRVELYVQMPINSFNMALATFAGQNIGAKNIPRVREGAKQTVVLAFVVTTVISALVILFCDQIIGAFGIGGQAAEYCRSHLLLCAFAFMYQALYLPIHGVFQGAGDGFAITRTAMGALATRILATYTLCYLPFMGYRIVWWNIAFGFLVGSIIAWSHYFSGKWLDKAIVK